MSNGPIEVLVLGFPGNQFSGEILPELARLVTGRQIAILDLKFVAKGAGRPSCHIRGRGRWQ